MAASRDAGFATVWGNGTASTAVDTGAGMSLAKEQIHTIYVNLPNSAVNQDAPSGTPWHRG